MLRERNLFNGFKMVSKSINNSLEQIMDKANGV